MDADERTQQLLRAYGERSAPSPQKRDRAWAAIAAAVAATPAIASAPPAGNLVLKTALGVGAVLTIGLASWSWGRTSDGTADERTAHSTHTAPASGAVAAPTTPEEEVSAPDEGEAAPSPTAIPARETEPSMEAHAVEPSEELAPSEATTAPAVVVPIDPPTSGTLAEELALMDRARQAIARNDAAEALRALDDHATRFPQGTLIRERDVLRVTALCVAGREDEAIEVAAAAGPRPAITRALSRCGAP